MIIEVWSKEENSDKWRKTDKFLLTMENCVRLSDMISDAVLRDFFGDAKFTQAQLSKDE